MLMDTHMWENGKTARWTARELVHVLMEPHTRENTWTARCTVMNFEIHWWVIVQGEWKHSKPHGKSTYYTWSDGRLDEGWWKDGKRQGKGVMTYANIDIYDGEWKDHLQNCEAYAVCQWKCLQRWLQKQQDYEWERSLRVMQQETCSNLSESGRKERWWLNGWQNQNHS